MIPLVLGTVNRLPRKHQLFFQYAASHVLDFNGVKVGLIGYVTVDTPYISSPDATLVFANEIDSIKAEAAALKEQQGENKL